jgi:hypothetical protein
MQEQAQVDSAVEVLKHMTLSQNSSMHSEALSRAAKANSYWRCHQDATAAAGIARKRTARKPVQCVPNCTILIAQGFV